MTENEEVRELEELIRYHADKYANGEPEIEDLEFDDLIARLTKIDPENPVLFEVGAAVTGGSKVPHAIVMGSLDKILYGENGEGIIELHNWIMDHGGYGKIVKSWKVDGLAGELVFAKITGRLIVASNRGDGEVGSDVTENVRASVAVPTSIFIPKDNPLSQKEIKIRGEFYIPLSHFEDKLEGEFANPRNAASGAMGHQDPSKTTRFNIHFRAYRLFVGEDERNPYFHSLSEEVAFFASLKAFHGTKEIPVHYVMQDSLASIQTVDQLQKEIDGLDIFRKSKIVVDGVEAPQVDYLTDGLVFAIDDNETRDAQGMKGQNKRGMRAFKFQSEKAESAVRDIVWQNSRTGVLSPVAIIEPTLIAGSTIRRSTLHNLATIRRLGLSIGSKILIIKSGEVIPKIVRVIEKGDGGENYPEVCPLCKTPTESDGIRIFCPNKACGSQLLGSLRHWVKTLGILDVGEVILQALIDIKVVHAIPDLYKVQRETLLALPRMGERSADVYLTAMYSVTKAPLNIFLAALGIRNLGEGGSKNIAKKFKNLAAVRAASLEDFLSVKDVGPITANSVFNSLKDLSGIIDELAAMMTIEDIKEKDGIFKGKRFCCTGKVSLPRKVIQDQIEGAGGEYTSISKGLNYLIIGEGAIPAKIDKAKKFGAEVLTDAEYKKLAGL